MTMTREHIETVVLRHLARTIDNVDPATLDPTRTMSEYGVNSLDIVEIVSASMRELKVKVPRAQLGGIANIAGLVDVLHAAATAKAQATP